MIAAVQHTLTSVSVQDVVDSVAALRRERIKAFVCRHLTPRYRPSNQEKSAIDPSACFQQKFLAPRPGLEPGTYGCALPLRNRALIEPEPRGYSDAADSKRTADRTAIHSAGCSTPKPSCRRKSANEQTKTREHHDVGRRLWNRRHVKCLVGLIRDRQPVRLHALGPALEPVIGIADDPAVFIDAGGRGKHPTGGNGLGPQRVVQISSDPADPYCGSQLQRFPIAVLAHDLTGVVNVFCKAGVRSKCAKVRRDRPLPQRGVQCII